MEQTPLPPLVGDEELDKWQDQRRGGKGGITFKWNAPKVRDHYEKDRQRTREVVQALVESNADLLNRMNDLCAFIAANGSEKMTDELVEKYAPKTLNIAALSALALAKSQLQIEPTKP